MVNFTISDINSKQTNTSLKVNNSARKPFTTKHNTRCKTVTSSLKQKLSQRLTTSFKDGRKAEERTALFPADQQGVT